MFLGMAPEIKKRLNVPVVCGLTGEDLFVEDMQEPYRSETLALMQTRARMLMHSFLQATTMRILCRNI